ncbi:MAG: flagellar biosynthetic protein FliO [Lentisphaerales bacterium]|nr:flagellar biosynthetic protein FliO [Lentisphaerales bacterium]
MKNLLYIFTLSILGLTQAVFSQDKIGPQETSPALTQKTEEKALFGSEQHKSSLGLGENTSKQSEDILLKTCLSLAAVIGLIVLIFYILKKVNHKVYNNGGVNPLRVFSRLPLDGKNYLTLVRVYEEEFLLSVGPNGTTVVARYALIDKEDGDNDAPPQAMNGQRPFIIDEETHVTSISLNPVKESKNDQGK